MRAADSQFRTGVVEPFWLCTGAARPGSFARTGRRLCAIIEQDSWLDTQGLRDFVQSQKGDVLLAPFHAADMRTIGSHTLADCFLTQPSRETMVAQVCPEESAYVHCKDGHHSRILLLRIKIPVTRLTQPSYGEPATTLGR